MSNGVPGAPPPAKKGLGPLAWIGIGCGVLVIVGFVVVAALAWWGVGKVKEAGFDPKEWESNPAMATVRMMVAANPELEMVEADSEKGIVTVRNTRTGEVMTVDLADVEEGRISFRNEDGEETTFEAQGEGEEGSVRIQSGEETVTFGSGGATQVPDWVPQYAGTRTEGGFFVEGEAGVRGGFGIETGDSPEQVLEFYRSELEGQGFTVNVNTFTENGSTTGGLLQATEEGGPRTMQVGVGRDGATTTITVSYGFEE